MTLRSNVSTPLSCMLALLLVLTVSACAGSSTQKTDESEREALTESAEADPEDGDAPADEIEVDPDNPPDGFETMEVFRVVPTAEGAAVILIDEDERIAVPIFVGRTIGMTIQLRLERRRYTRPLTHDLMDEMVDQLGGELLKVHIDDVKSGIFVGTVYMRDESGDVLTFDSRSSDAVAVALGHGVPIFVSRDVVEKAGVDTEQFEGGGQVPEEQLPESPESPQTQPL